MTTKERNRAEHNEGLEVLAAHQGCILAGRRAVPGGWLYVEYAWNTNGAVPHVQGVSTCFVLGALGGG